MRAPLIIAALLASPAAAQGTMDGMDAHHHDRLLSFTRMFADYAPAQNAATWEGEGWIGGDRHKFWWKSEGDIEDGTAERAEAQALYSRNVWTFFDVQAGIAHDFAPDARTYLVAGIQGLAPYLLDTELHAFVGLKGDVRIRARQSFDLLITNRFVLTPTAEADFYLTDVPERAVASGFSRVETGLVARYEISRKFAPYVAAIWDSKVGGTRRIAQAAGEDPGGWRVSGGVRVWF